jgi:dihydroxyacetone kinase-like predicted kinase
MQEKPIAIVGIVAGSGLADIFKSLGTDIVIEGGQTMNPSTEDIVRAVEQAPSQTVFILPNNKNIIMAAQQAKFISSKQIYVIPTTTIPQGIAALLAFNPELQNHEALANTMEAASQDIVTGQLTYSIRDTIVEDQSIHEGDYIALYDGHIAAVSPDREIALNQLLDKILEEPHEIVTIYYGQEVSEERSSSLPRKGSDEISESRN